MLPENFCILVCFESRTNKASRRPEFLSAFPSNFQFLLNIVSRIPEILNYLVSVLHLDKKSIEIVPSSNSKTFLSFILDAIALKAPRFHFYLYSTSYLCRRGSSPKASIPRYFCPKHLLWLTTNFSIVH